MKHACYIQRVVFSFLPPIIFFILAVYPASAQRAPNLADDTMGSPKNPSADQIEALEKAGQLQLYSSPEWVTVKNDQLELKLDMPRQAVSLLKYSW